MKTIFHSIIVVFMLSSCQLTRVEGQVEDVEIKVSTKDGNSSDSNGKFCPPGQSKKGNC